MKINELLYKTPEMTEDKLLEIINSHENWIPKNLMNRVEELHKGDSFSVGMLKEYDLIQDKNSYLTRSQRDTVVGFVGLCMIEMTKGTESDGGNH